MSHIPHVDLLSNPTGLEEFMGRRAVRGSIIRAGVHEVAVAGLYRHYFNRKKELDADLASNLKADAMAESMAKLRAGHVASQRESAEVRYKLAIQRAQIMDERERTALALKALAPRVDLRRPRRSTRGSIRHARVVGRAPRRAVRVRRVSVTKARDGDGPAPEPPCSRSLLTEGVP